MRRYRPRRLNHSCNPRGNRCSISTSADANGKKVTILLDESDSTYNLVPCRHRPRRSVQARVLKINPNHRMPVLVDHAPKGAEPTSISIFESGPIMMYLAEKEGRFFGARHPRKIRVAQWSFGRWPIRALSSANWPFPPRRPEAGDLT